MATEMWFLRKMLKIRWVDKVTDNEVLCPAGTKRRIIQTIAKRYISFLGHVMRKEKIEQFVKTGKIISKRSRGRQPRKITDQIKNWTVTSCNTIFSSAQRKEISWLPTPLEMAHRKSGKSQN